MVEEKQGSRLKGVVADSGEQQLPYEFITTGKTLPDALGRSVIRDEQQRNDIIVYIAQLKMFGLETELEDLTNYLNASAAIEGINRRQALMGHVRIYEPLGAGAKNTPKEAQRAIMEAQRYKKSQNDNQNHDHSGGDHD